MDTAFAFEACSQVVKSLLLPLAEVDIAGLDIPFVQGQAALARFLQEGEIGIFILAELAGFLFRCSRFSLHHNA